MEIKVYSCSKYIILNKDGTCILKEVDYLKLVAFPKNKDKKLNAKGTWSLINNADSGIIDGKTMQ